MFFRELKSFCSESGSSLRGSKNASRLHVHRHTKDARTLLRMIQLPSFSRWGFRGKSRVLISGERRRALVTTSLPTRSTPKPSDSRTNIDRNMAPKRRKTYSW